MTRFAVLIMVILIVGCKQKSPEAISPKEVPAQINSPQQGNVYLPFDHLEVKTLQGDKTTLDVDDRTLVVGVATWCPHSRNFVKTISSPDIKPVFKGYTWVFLLTENEWPTVRKHLVEMEKSGELNGKSADAALEEMKKRAGNGPLYDPEVLDTLPGKVFVLPDASRPKIKSFPVMYSRTTGSFDAHPMEWVRDQSGAAYALYLKYEESSDSDNK